MSRHPIEATVRAVGISGSPAPYSSISRVLLVRALDQLCRRGTGRAELIELALLPPEGLLGRSRDEAVEKALAAVASADILVVSTPVYRGSYSTLLKLFVDLLPHRALEGKPALAIVTGASPGHRRVLEAEVRPLLAGLGAVALPGGISGSEEQFENGTPEPALVEQVDRVAAQALDGLRAARAQLRSLASSGVARGNLATGTDAMRP